MGSSAMGFPFFIVSFLQTQWCATQILNKFTICIRQCQESAKKNSTVLFHRAVQLQLRAENQGIGLGADLLVALANLFQFVLKLAENG